eukprot:TRINITY_DN8925_c0_g1_i1.p1 TRINITY_DN8925_c0_g1~~TRINITY_DN8925_c0_g1_i1.p1  ORF type:complete len:318 (+),score=81.36 TRINITY_DN8925_c0_g1_i1:70-1023(+)
MQGERRPAALGVLRKGGMPYPAPKRQPAKAPVPSLQRRRGFDQHDLAPEDRLDLAKLAKPDPVFSVFGPYAPVVRGSLVLHGVNYAKYEALRGKAAARVRFLDALREDLISEVGNGVRKEDILLNVLPGEIRSVVLSYGGGEGPAPQLLDADWDLAVAYAIRARDVRRQNNVAVALYTALTTAEGFRCDCTRRCYVEFVDPEHGDCSKVYATVPPPSIASVQGPNYGLPARQQTPVEPHAPVPRVEPYPRAAPPPSPAPNGQLQHPLNVHPPHACGRVEGLGPRGYAVFIPDGDYRSGSALSSSRHRGGTGETDVWA